MKAISAELFIMVVAFCDLRDCYLYFELPASDFFFFFTIIFFLSFLLSFFCSSLSAGWCLCTCLCPCESQLLPCSFNRNNDRLYSGGIAAEILLL